MACGASHCALDFFLLTAHRGMSSSVIKHNFSVELNWPLSSIQGAVDGGSKTPHQYIVDIGIYYIANSSR